MTAFGAYINEATVANQEVFNEIKSRCSGEGARILIDTNPDNPMHWLNRITSTRLMEMDCRIPLETDR